MHIKSFLDLSYCLWFYSAGWPSSALLLLFSMYMIVQTNMELNRHISQWWLAFWQIFKPWRAITIFKYFLTFQVTVKPPVSDHPKCEDSAVAYGRWTLACVASVSVPFRGKEQEREPKTARKMGRKQHPAKTENPSPRRSLVFLCSETTRKRLLRSLYRVAYGK